MSLAAIPKTAADIIPLLLAYVKYLCLMALLLLLGCLAGLVYFVYSPAVYQSRSLIDLKMYALPIASDGLDTRRLHRSLLDQLNSRQAIASTAHRMGIAKPEASFEELRQRQLKKISVSMLDWSTLQIDVFSENPEIVREFPKAMVTHFEEYQHELRLSFLDKAVQKYKDELGQLRERIDQKLREQTDFTKNNAVAEVVIQQSALAQIPVDMLLVQYRLQKYANVRDQISTRKGDLDPIDELSLLESVKQSAMDGNALGSIISASGDIKDSLTSPTMALRPQSQKVIVQPAMLEGLTPWQNLDKELRASEQEYQEVSRVFLDDHPKVIQIKGRQRQIKEQIQAELEAERRKFEVELQRLKDEFKQLESKLPEYNAQTDKLNKLKSDYTLSQEGDLAWTKAYTDLAKTLTSIQFGVDKDRVDLQFKGYSLLRDDDPVSPTKYNLAIMALTLGIGMALGVPFTLEKLDDRAKGLDAIEQVTGMKGLGVIPKADPDFIEQIEREKEEDFSRPNHLLECYRVLRSHLVLEMNSILTPPGQGKVVFLTSARPSEGKSLTAANLGWAFQSMGSKVLLVDLDFRRGRVHRFFSADPFPGLCQVLTGEIQPADAIRSSSLPLLDFISRGSTVSGSSELLCRLGIEDLVVEWRKQYDWIILDSPPMLGLSETSVLQRVADAVLIVVRAEQTPMADLKNAVAQLKKTEAKVVGFVLNGVDLAKISNYYNYYYYSQNYYDVVNEKTKA